MEVIPRTLAQNCGANVIRTLTKLRAKHAETPVGEPCPWGIDGETGQMPGGMAAASTGHPSSSTFGDKEDTHSFSFCAREK
jgi:chaperonin GroEL (HSP60 family)